MQTKHNHKLTVVLVKIYLITVTRVSRNIDHSASWKNQRNEIQNETLRAMKKRTQTRYKSSTLHDNPRK